MKTNNRRPSRKQRGMPADLVSSSYVIPSISVGPAYPITLRLTLQLAATALGPFTISFSPNVLARFVQDQLLNSAVTNTTITAAGGAVTLIPATVTPIFSFIRIKTARVWGVTGGQAEIAHLAIGASTGSFLVPATAKKDAQSTGTSSKPCAIISFPNESGMAYPSGSTGNAIQTTFSGYSSLLDDTVIIDFNCVLFD